MFELSSSCSYPTTSDYNILTDKLLQRFPHLYNLPGPHFDHTPWVSKALLAFLMKISLFKKEEKTDIHLPAKSHILRCIYI